MKKIFVCGILLAVCFFARGFAGEEDRAPAGWFEDLAAAKKKATDEDRDLLINFSGSDWCGFCIRLDQAVFRQEAFQREAEKDFVLTIVDFPRGEDAKRKIRNPEMNQRILESYGVEGFPTVMLCLADGRPYARTGFIRGTAKDYLAHLEELKKQKRTVSNAELAHKAAKSPGEKLKAGKAVLDLFLKLGIGAYYSNNLFGEIAAETVRDFEKTREELGADAAQLAVDVLMASGKIAEYGEFVGGIDPKNELGGLEMVTYIAAANLGDKDLDAALEKINKFMSEHKLKNIGQDYHVLKGIILFRLKRFAESLKELEVAKAMPGRLTERIPELIEHVRQTMREGEKN